ncbi:MAG: glycosyltransferase family 4 protein [Candidatus Acidiferrales bacterium]
MRIAVWHNLPSGGAKRALYDQVRGLLARGHQVEAWCPPTADQSYLPLNTMVREHVVPLGFSAGSAPNLLAKLRPLYWNASARLRAMDRHCRQCAEEINASGFDLLFAAVCVFFRTTSIARFAKIPSVIYLQEPYRFFYESLPELPWLALSWTPKDLFDPHFWSKALLSRLLLPGIRVRGREERKNAMAFDDILVNSFFSRESVLRAYGLDSKVCYLGIDTEKFVNRYEKREPTAVSVGMLGPTKNVEFIIRSVATTSVQIRPKLLWIANMTDPPYLKQMRRLAEVSGVNFEVKQRIEDSELVDILNRARMMLYAPRLEPFGYAPLEANACGLPVIAVAEGGVRETIRDGVNGILVEHDPLSMASAIERLMRDGELARRLGENACLLVRDKWSLPSSIDRVESRLRSTLTKAQERTGGVR